LEIWLLIVTVSSIKIYVAKFHDILFLVNCVAHDPPTICIGIVTNRDGSKKDTLSNIDETGEFVVNIISEWMVESANYTSCNYPPEINEMEMVGLTPIPSEIVKPPRVKESGFHMECQLTHRHEVVNDNGIVTSTVVFGRVVRFHILEPLLGRGPKDLPLVSLSNYRPVAKLGGNFYTTLGGIFELARPTI
jgi:flavin reductase (DIM6/NTAB) family NADH-FMN oxidoreductase RutF